jgi:cyclopropane fatty-acyl-phospholipid synthase-like methyltransferase
MVRAHYGNDHDVIISTGFLDFLGDAEADHFCKLVYNALKPGGKFITSGMQPHKLSEFLMRQFAELHAVYRSRDELVALAKRAGFATVHHTQDRYGLQTVIVATK